MPPENPLAGTVPTVVPGEGTFAPTTSVDDLMGSIASEEPAGVATTAPEEFCLFLVRELAYEFLLAFCLLEWKRAKSC